MKKLKMIFTILYAILLLITVTSCEEKKEEPIGKYDISIKIKNNFGKSWVFNKYTQSITYEQNYTGKEMYFYVYAYGVLEHPLLDGLWLKPNVDGTCLFSSEIRKKNIVQNIYEEYYGYIYEEGEYSFMVTTNSSVWNNRTIILYINII